MRATLINYFDVWGNEEEGYEVNNLCKEGELEFEGNEAPTDQQILDKLKEFGFIVESADLSDLEFEDLWPYIEFSEIREHNNLPLGRLEFED